MRRSYARIALASNAPNAWAYRCQKEPNRFRFYGSLRARTLVDGDRKMEFDGQTSCVGVRVEYDVPHTALGTFWIDS